MTSPTEASRIETIGTALALCTSDVISGNLSTCRVHLSGTQKRLSSAIRDDVDLPTSLDPTWTFLLKWYETLDMFAAISSLQKSTVRYGQYRSATGMGYIDEFVGCSLALMPLLARIGWMIRMQRKQKQVFKGTDDYEDERLERHIREGMADEVHHIERKLLGLLERKTHPSIAENPQTKTISKDLELTHQIFVYASLLHLYRQSYSY